MPFPYNLLSPRGRGKGEGGGKGVILPSLSSPFHKGGHRGLSYGILPGIMRQAVIETARENGLKVVEGKITVKELMNADEAFLTNSIIEVVPLVGVDSKPIGDKRPGSVTRRIQFCRVGTAHL